MSLGASLPGASLSTSLEGDALLLEPRFPHPLCFRGRDLLPRAGLSTACGQKAVSRRSWESLAFAFGQGWCCHGGDGTGSVCARASAAPPRLPQVPIHGASPPPADPAKALASVWGAHTPPVFSADHFVSALKTQLTSCLFYEPFSISSPSTLVPRRMSLSSGISEPFMYFLASVLTLGL